MESWPNKCSVKDGYAFTTTITIIVISWFSACSYGLSLLIMKNSWVPLEDELSGKFVAYITSC